MKTILLLCFILNLNILADTETVSLDFELNQTAINRALVSQFNNPNFMFQHFTGEFEFLPGQIVPYDIQLTRPTVEIGDNSIGIHLVFIVVLPTLGLNYELDVTPDITINEQSIKASEVVAFIENLDGEINNFVEIPQSVRILLIGLYETYEPEVYASNLYNKILDEINSDEFIQQRAFSVTNFGISMAFNIGKLVIKAILDVTYGDIIFTTKLTNSNPDKLLLNSNIKCKVKQVFITTTDSDVPYSNDNLNLELTKDPSTGSFKAEISLGDVIATNNYIWTVLYETDATFYYNKYKGFPDIAWYTPEEWINH